MTLVITRDSVTRNVAELKPVPSTPSFPLCMDRLAASRLVSKASQVVVGVMALGCKTIQTQGGTDIQFYQRGLLLELLLTRERSFLSPS